jgi:epoxyqueuosine reductase
MAGSFEEIRKILLESGAALVGFADMAAIPPEDRRGMGCALSIAVALNPAVVSRITKGPTKEYFREYRRANALLSELSHRAAELLQERGFAATALEPTTEEFDAVRLRAGLSHKIAATRSGLGWVGKNALVITKAFGSAIRLTTVLTDAPLKAGTPLDESKCGTCTACVEICPAKAPTGANWRLGLYRDDFFDAFACCRKATEFCEREGIDSTICGICIGACPWTKRYLKRALSRKSLSEMNFPLLHHPWRGE